MFWVLEATTREACRGGISSGCGVLYEEEGSAAGMGATSIESDLCGASGKAQKPGNGKVTLSE